MNSPESTPIVGKDHFAEIETRPVKATFDPNLSVPAQLADRVHTISTPPAAPNYEARIAALEALLAGFSRRTIDVCDAGTAKTMTIVSTAPA